MQLVSNVKAPAFNKNTFAHSHKCQERDCNNKWKRRFPGAEKTDHNVKTLAKLDTTKNEERNSSNDPYSETYFFVSVQTAVEDQKIAETDRFLNRGMAESNLKQKCKAQTTLAHIHVFISNSKMPTFYRRTRITSRDIRLWSWKNPKLSENTIIWQGGPDLHFWRHTWHSPWNGLSLWVGLLVWKCPNPKVKATLKQNLRFNRTNSSHN